MPVYFPGPSGWILLTESSSRFDVEFRTGVMARARELGMEGIRLCGERDLLPAISALRQGRRQPVGVINHVRNTDVMAGLRASGVPCILLGEDEAESWQKQIGSPIAACATDHRAVGRMAAGYLHGQRRFNSYLYAEARSRSQWQYWADLRYEGFADDMRQRGNKDAIPRLSMLDADPELDRRRLAEAVASLPRPVGAFCCNDRIAHAVASGCRAAGMRVSDDVAVLGVDDAREICEHAPVTLSSISVDRGNLGRRALALMLEMLASGTQQDMILRGPPLRLVERESTRPGGTSNPFVARVLRLIAREAHAKLSTARMVAESGASRSYLERHFKAVTGETLHGYLESAILREVQHQLATTGIPVTHIAASMGYDSPFYLCTKFRQCFGMTMQEYRQSRRDGPNFHHCAHNGKRV